MPSPFPGMDPFLENPEIFPDVHDALITYIREFLQPALPQPYYSPIGRRAWIEKSERYVQPDVNIARKQGSATSPRQEAGGVAVARESTTSPIIVHVPHDERREPFVEIYVGRGSERRLVTHIEVLSPSNKMRGPQGRDLYLRKQQEILESQVHLVEIDLLRGGLHATAVPFDRLRESVAAFDYHVCVHRFDRFEDYAVYPIQLAEPLPKIDVPLLPEDGTVSLDLQAVFDRCYDTGPYRVEIEYQHDTPVPPLSDDQTAWIKAQLSKPSNMTK